MNDPDLVVIEAGAIRDAMGLCARPGIITIRQGRIIDAGPPKPQGSSPTPSHVIHCPDELVLPAMINAHTHLELTHIGPQPYPGNFFDWVAMLRAHGLGDRAAGAAMLRESGIRLAGDITQHQSPAGPGVQDYLEVFGVGPPWDQAGQQRIAQLAQLPQKTDQPKDQPVVGIQPHSPYAAGPGLYARASASDLPVCTHLAETRDELRFVAAAVGPCRTLLEQLGKWDDAFEPLYQAECTPVQWMRPYLEQTPWLLAHCNYVTDDDLAILANTGASVAYCPAASAYFGHVNHRYQDMLDLGINVCLGTDSIVCQPGDEPQPMGVLAQMRYLHQRDQADPHQLLAMATTHGMAALRRDPRQATLQPGAQALFACVRFDVNNPADPLAQVLTGREPIRPLNVMG